MFVNQIVKYAGAFTAELGGLDNLVFTGGIGENSVAVRQRVSAAPASVGPTLSIKPILHASDEGKLTGVGMARGRKSRLNTLIDTVGRLGIDLQEQTMFICHGDCYDDAKFVADYIRERSKVQDVIINYVGPVIGSHTGPGVVSVFFLGTER